jgi:amino acid adenylation domain-containing protein
MRPELVPASYRLSSMQEGMLFHYLRNAGSGVDIEQLVCTLPEAIDSSALRRACQALVQRYDVFRTRFQWENVPQPVQNVCVTAEAAFDVTDVSHLAPEVQEARIKEYLEEDRATGFPLDQAPMTRFTLFRQGSSQYKFIWTFHHVVMDGRSFPIVLRELFDLYEAERTSSGVNLPEQRPYFEYIRWLETLDHSKAEGFWRKHLEGFGSATQIPALDGVSETPGRAEMELRLSKEATEALRTIAAREGFTLNNIVQGAWGLVLAQQSASKDVVFGVTRACRSFSPHAGEMVGIFINTLPLRIRAESGQRLYDWFREIRAANIEQRDYEHTPLAAIQSWSEAPRGTPLFDSILVFDNYLLNSKMQSLGGAWGPREIQLLERTNFPLTLYGYGESSLILKLAYEQERFSPASIERTLGHFQTVLESIACDIDRPLSGISILTAGEKRQLTQDWNDTKSDYPSGRLIHDLIAEQSAKTPDNIAVSFGDRSLTYRELDVQANRLANYLRKRGAGPHGLVGIFVERSVEMVVGLLAILKTGAAYLPLDPIYPKERLAFMIADSEVALLLTQDSLAPSVGPQFKGTLVCLDLEWPEIAREEPRIPSADITPEARAYTIYTSGSTGIPKGVQLSHRNAVNLLYSFMRQLPVCSQDVLVAVTTLSFDIAGLEIWMPLLCGAQTAIASRETSMDGAELVEELRRRSASILQATPSTWQLLLDAGWQGDPNLTALCGGEAFPVELAGQLKSKVKHIWNVYGPTETTIWSTACRLLPGDERITIGRPVANTQLYILDEDSRLAPRGVPGELYIGGDGVALGYWNRPELNAEKFVPDPFAPDGLARLYRTGDRVRYRADGNVEFQGRFDQQVKLRGYRIELGEITQALERHPQVKEAVVTVLEGTQSSKRLIGYIVPRAATPGIAELKDHLKQTLPEYMLPSQFMFLDAMPRLSNGKINRHALPSPETVESKESDSYVAPREATEKQLVAIWETLLNHRPIGIRENFFDLGGHSLLLTRLLGQIQKEFGKRLSIATMFESPTIEEQAAVLRGQKTHSAVCRVIPLKPQGSRPAFICLGASPLFLPLARLLGPDQPFYGLDLTELQNIKLPTPCRLEDVAAYVVGAIQEFQPQGPYYVGGWCMFGVLAYEVGRQLMAQGQAVELLTIIDTPNPAYNRGLSQMSRLNAKVQKALFHLATLLRAKPKEMLRYALERARNLRNKVVRLRERLSFEMGLQQVDIRLMDLDPILFYAAVSYEAPGYPGPVLIIQAKERPSGRHWQLAEQWRERMSNEVVVHYVPGGHEGMFKYPHVEILANAMKQSFDWAAGKRKVSNGDGLPAPGAEPVLEEISRGRG